MTRKAAKKQNANKRILGRSRGRCKKPDWMHRSTWLGMLKIAKKIDQLEDRLFSDLERELKKGLENE